MNDITNIQPTEKHSALIEELKLVASDPQTNAYFGYSVSITDNGDRVAIGAYRKNEGGFISAGATYIFSRSGTTWTQEAKLVVSDPQAYANFGNSVSITADGDRVAIGARGKNEGGTNAGATYIFIRSGTTWTQEAKLVASDLEASAYFGYSVSITANGDRVAIGAYNKTEGGFSYAGATYIFSRSGTTWTQEAKLVASDPEASAYFGRSVSITTDGDRVAIGAERKNEGGFTSAGSTYIFIRSGTTWTQEAKLVASDPQASAYFGWSVSITANGDRVAIGAYRKNEGGFSYAGATYIFSRSGTTWTQEAKLVASDPEDDARFGRSVSITDNGDRVAIGACLKNEGGFTNAGATYIFSRSGTTWTQEAKLVASDTQSYSNFGISVSMSASGDRVVIGAYGENEDGFNNAGAIYIFS